MTIAKLSFAKVFPFKVTKGFKGILTSIKIKNKIYDKYCRAKDVARKNILHTQFKKYRNTINNLIRISKDSHYKTYFNENKRNSMKVWQGVRELINSKGENKVNPKSLTINDNLVTDKKKVASEFNDFFSTVAPKIDSKIIPTNYRFKNAFTNSNNLNFLPANY